MPTSRDLVNALERHYRGGPGHRDQDSHATWTELQGPDGRRVDYLALGLWGNRGVRLDGHEIKVTRSDWLAELAQPSKAEQWWKACSRWWLVVPDASIVQDGELPDGWGLMTPPTSANRRSMKVIVPAPVRDVPVPFWLTVTMVKRDRYTHAERLRSAVYQAEHDARRKGYDEGKAALEKRVGRVITNTETERLELLDRIERTFGAKLERYVWKRDGEQIEPETAALALQVAHAIQSITGPSYDTLDRLLTRIGQLTDAAKDLTAAQSELRKLLPAAGKDAA